MKKHYLLLFILICVWEKSFSQGWEKVYQNIYSDDMSYGGASIQKIQITSDGGNILIGYGPDSLNINHSRNYIIKTDSLGNIQWSRFIKDTASMLVECITETNGGYLIGGIYYTPRFGFLLKIDMSGNILWSKSYNGSQTIELFQKTDRGFILLGMGTSYNGGIYLAEIDSAGSVNWSRTFNSGWFFPQGIVPTEDKGFIVVAKKESYTYGKGNEADVIRFDSLGNMVWARSYMYYNNFTIHSIKATADGNYILGGSVLMKIDKQGNILWVNEWNLSIIYDLNQTSDGGYIAIAGDGWNIGGIFLFKISDKGIPQWKRQFGGERDQATSISITSDGGFLLAGVHSDNTNMINGFYLIKTDNLGMSGCNTEKEEPLNYQVAPSLCVINNITFAMGTNSATGVLPETTQPVIIRQIDPCCYAKAEIMGELNCKGDSIHISGSGAPNLVWYTGQTGSAIVTKDTVVWLSVSNTCGTFTDTLIIHPSFVPSFTYTANKNSICRGDSITLTISGNAPYYSLYGDGVNSLSPTNYIIKPSASTVYTISGYTGYRGPGCASFQNFTVTLNPDKPIITRKGDTLISSATANNQWFLNGNSISGATGRTYITSVGGTYAVNVSGIGCSNFSDDFTYIPDTFIYAKNAWQKMIKGANWGQGTCLVEAADSGFVIGSNYVSSETGYDIVLIKTNRQGEVVWSKTYGSKKDDRIYSIIKIAGGYVAVGSTSGFGNGSSDVYLLSFDNNGSLLWSKTYGDWNTQEGLHVEQTSARGYILTGYSTDPHTYAIDHYGSIIAENDVYLIKTDAAGNLLWSKTFDAFANERGIEAHETNDGNFIVAARSEDSLYKSSAYILKTDGDGNLLWSKKITGPSSSQYVSSMKILADNNYLVAAGTYTGTLLFKLDPNGNSIWSKLVPGSNVWTQEVLATADTGAIFICSMGVGTTALTKIDRNGNLDWGTTYNTGVQQYVEKIIQLSDKSLLLIGSIDTSSSYGPDQINLVNTDENGLINCGESYIPLISNESCNYISHTTASSSLGTEMSNLADAYGGSFQTRTICRSYAPPQIEKQKVGENLVVRVYPNPSEGMINIEFPETQSTTHVRVLDVTGRCVNDQFVEGKTTFILDLSSKRKGIYFVELTSRNQKNVKKILLQ
jgi:hypothetical protein